MYLFVVDKTEILTDSIYLLFNKRHSEKTHCFIYFGNGVYSFLKSKGLFVCLFVLKDLANH